MRTPKNVLLLVVLTQLLCLSSNAQNQLDSLFESCHSFVQYERNVFTGQPYSMPMQRYHQDFDRMMRYNEGRLNIVHFGGSHIQVDIWSNLLRDRLQNIDSTIHGSRGVVFPFKTAGTNRPYSYTASHTGTWDGHRSSYNKHVSTWGVTGITATTKDTVASLKFTFHESVTPVKIQSAAVLSNALEAGFKMWVVPGDSTNGVTIIETDEGYHQIEFLNEVDSIEIMFTKAADNANELQFYGLVLDNERPGITYHSIGVNGSRFHSFKRCELFDEQLKYLNPDLVIMSIGTNDSSEPDYDSTTYKQNYREFLDQILAVNPQCAFILTVPNDNYVRRKYHNDNLRSVRNVINELALEYDAPVWDLYGLMGDAGSSKVWRDADMMKADLVHFTNAGYKLKGDLFYKAFLEDYLRWYNDQKPVWTE